MNWDQQDLLPAVTAMLQAYDLHQALAVVFDHAGGDVEFGCDDDLFDCAIDFLGVDPDDGDGSRDWTLEAWNACRSVCGRKVINEFIEYILEENKKGTE